VDEVDVCSRWHVVVSMDGVGHFRAGSATIAVAYLAGPLNAGPVFNALGFSGVVAVIVGVRMHRPAARFAWYLIALGLALFVSGDVLAYNYTALFGGALPFPSVADPVYLAVYPTTVAGLLLLIRRRNPGRNWASLIDATIVTISLALLSWVFLMAPYAHDPALHLGTKLVSIAYPLGDILILGVAVRMAVGAGRRSTAYYMAIGAIVAVLATDSVYGWILLHGTYHPGDPLDGGWIVYYLLWGAAALHPSMATVSQAAAPKVGLTRVRILAIAAAALVAPVIEVVKASAHGGSDDVVVGCAAGAVFALVVLRMIGLARESTALVESLTRTASEARLTALVQHSTDVILVITSETTVEYASASVQAVLGYDAADFTGRRLLDYVAEEDRALFHPALSVLLASASETSQGFEFRVRHSDGRMLDTEWLITNLLDNAAVTGIVVNLRDITERKRFEEQLTYQAFHDPVTDLPNRALFHDRVGHALMRRRTLGKPIGVLFLDLDDFKTVNDTVGHAAGDRVLQIISSRLRSALRVGDTVARLGGDEFAILLEDVAHETAVSEIVENLLDVISAPLMIDDREVSVQCSIGIAVAQSPVETGAVVTADELLRDADVAMYQAKAARGNAYLHFKPAMHEAIVEQLVLRAELKAAIAAEELTLAYQPIFDLQTGEISGYEALLRWESAEHGTVPPSTFIPIAEDSGLIIPLGRWVLNHACKEAVALRPADPHEQERFVAVNISARQLQRTEIVAEVRAALRASGLDPSQLLLEITESVTIDDVELAIERLGSLRELGVRIAIDDFGTGQSSLAYIQRLPIDILKIDKQFIDSVDADGTDSKLTAAIIGLARLLDLDCVAEGVERPAQHERLRELGCEYAQGFLFARPMTPAALSELLNTPAPEPVEA
jgi:diguanylate cyclase (GGDEF)-like protein/PAS domain S-box-containing protein